MGGEDLGLQVPGARFIFLLRPAWVLPCCCAPTAACLLLNRPSGPVRASRVPSFDEVSAAVQTAAVNAPRATKRDAKRMLDCV